MPDLADYIARNVLLVLAAVSLALLVATALFWHFIHRYGDRSWQFSVTTWNRLRASELAQRLKGVPLAGLFFTRTLTVVRYLGLYAVVGFAFAISLIVAFVELADEIGLDESLGQFDADLAAAFRKYLSLETLRAFSYITTLGDPDFLIVLTTVTAVALLLRRQWVLGGAWIVATIGGGLMNMLLKAIFERPRPLHDHGIVTETNWSFPSGHASGSMLIYSLLGYLIVRHTPKAWHIPVAVITVAVIVFVGSSRVLLQVHYFSDVLAGYASAAAWVALCIAGLEALRWRHGQRVGVTT